MTTDLPVMVPKRRAIDLGTTIEIRDAFKLDSHASLSLPAIVVGLAGAAAIVYVATRHPRPAAAVPPADESKAIETTGVSLVK